MGVSDILLEGGGVALLGLYGDCGGEEGSAVHADEGFVLTWMPPPHLHSNNTKTHTHTRTRTRVTLARRLSSEIGAELPQSPNANTDPAQSEACGDKTVKLTFG